MHFQCPNVKLTQLQSRFAASLAASLLLAAIYFVLTSPRLAYAQELDGPSLARAQDHNWFRIEGRAEGLNGDGDGGDEEDVWRRQVQAAPDAASSASAAAASASSTASALPGNNSPGRLGIAGGETQQWVFAAADVTSDAVAEGSSLPGGWTDFTTTTATGSAVARRAAEEHARAAGVTVYVSINTCSQPTREANGTQGSAPPQLTLYASSMSSGVGPDGDADDQTVATLSEGYAALNLTATGDVYIAVAAPDVPAGFEGAWNYSVAASTDDYYHLAYTEDPPLYLLDTDSNGALLVTADMTTASTSAEVNAQWIDIDTLPFVLFATNSSNTAAAGLTSSFCGLQTTADLQSSATDEADLTDSGIQMEMVTRGVGSLPKQQFYMSSLTKATTFSAYLAMDGNSTASGDGVVGGGGRVWAARDVTTKSDGNCALVYNLTLCTEVAYAVPANPNTTSITALTNFYENYTSTYWTTFGYSLALIPCNASSTQQYSLSADCTMCQAAYLNWLCAVTMPRCVDFSSTATYLQPRNVVQAFIPATNATAAILAADLLASVPPAADANYSAATALPAAFLDATTNPMSNAPSLSNAKDQTYASAMTSNRSRVWSIDTVIAPGPYKELLPCQDLCYDLVRNCPAALGFACPYPGLGLEAGYGTVDADGDGSVTCNAVGIAYVATGGAGAVGAGGWGVWAAALGAAVVACL